MGCISYGRWTGITRCIFLVVLVVVTVVSAAQVGTARADPVADFYRGVTIRMLIGLGADGSYDIYCPLVA